MSECVYCGDPVMVGKTFCDDKCRQSSKEHDELESMRSTEYARGFSEASKLFSDSRRFEAAKAAMQGLLSNATVTNEGLDTKDCVDLATAARMAADALLAELTGPTSVVVKKDLSDIERGHLRVARQMAQRLESMKGLPHCAGYHLDIPDMDRVLMLCQAVIDRLEPK